MRLPEKFNEMCHVSLSGGLLLRIGAGTTTSEIAMSQNCMTITAPGNSRIEICLPDMQYPERRTFARKTIEVSPDHVCAIFF